MLIPVNDTWGAHFPPGTAERVVPALQTRRKAPGRDALAGRAAQAGQVRRRVARRPSIVRVTWDWPGSSVGLTRGSGWCRKTRNCTEIDRSGTMFKIVRRVYKFELFFLQPVVARASLRRRVRRECPLQAKREDTLNKESKTVMIA